MRLIGFDFGTTNSLVAQIKEDNPVLFLDEETGLPIPSIMCYEGDEKICGFRAKKRVETAELGVHKDIVRSPKILLGQESVFISGVERSPIDIVADSLEHTWSIATGHTLADLHDVDGAVVTIPVNMNGRKRQSLRAAFTKINLPIYQFIYEPFAALYGFFRNNNTCKIRYDNKILLVVDWGGGTLDFTLCILEGDYLYQIANYGTDNFGGDKFDELIKNYIFDAVIKERGLDNPEVSPGSIAKFLEKCEIAKKDLTDRDSAIVFIPNFFVGLDNNDLKFNLTKELMNKIVGSIVKEAFDHLSEFLSSNSISTQQVALCLATGGMSNMPIIKQSLVEQFGIRTEISKNSATLVAEGAAWLAHDMQELILAKQIDVELARKTYFCLLRAGDVMPCAGHALDEITQTFGCVDPRDGYAKFHFCSPLKPGKPLKSDPRINHDLLLAKQKIEYDCTVYDTVDTLGVKVDAKARPLIEDITVRYSVDQNLILHITITSEHFGDSVTVEIHDLEFGVKIHGIKSPKNGQFENIKKFSNEPECQHGSIFFKSNIMEKDARYNRKLYDYFIPGDLLYRMHPELFDVRNNFEIAECQKYEYEYINSRCSVCKRRVNDPLCTCTHKDISTFRYC